MQITRLKENKINIFLHDEELEDLRSMASLAIRQANEDHRDSPQFRKALHKIQRQLWKIRNRGKIESL